MIGSQTENLLLLFPQNYQLYIGCTDSAKTGLLSNCSIGSGTIFFSFLNFNIDNQQGILNKCSQVISTINEIFFFFTVSATKSTTNLKITQFNFEGN